MGVIVAKVNEWAVEANDTPVFLIRVPQVDQKSAVFYVVIAHWEYDRTLAETSAEEEGCDAIAAEFDSLASIGAEARITDPGRLRGLSLLNRPCTTRPRNPNCG